MIPVGTPRLRTSARQKAVLAHVRSNPGCCARSVWRAVEPESKHWRIYDAVNGLVRRGLLCVGKAADTTNGKARGLYAAH